MNRLDTQWSSLCDLTSSMKKCVTANDWEQYLSLCDGFASSMYKLVNYTKNIAERKVNSNGNNS